MVMPRIIEPPRPESFQKLPSYKDKSYWRSMARAIRLLKSGVLEISRYHDQRVRVTSFFVGIYFGLAVVFGAIYTYGSWSAFKKEMVDSYDYVFNFENVIRKQYKTTWKSVRDKYSEEEYLQQYLNGDIHDNRFLDKFGLPVFFGSTVIIFLLVAIFFPRRCPLRFDRSRELAYTWHKSKLYVADIGPYLGGLQLAIDSSRPGTPLMEHDKSTGPAVITLYAVDDPNQSHRFRIGLYPVCHAHQNLDINMMVQAFMNKHLFDEEGRRIDWSPTWLEKLDKSGFYPLDILRKQGQFTLGKKHEFDEEKTEQALLEYLTRPGTRDCRRPI